MSREVDETRLLRILNGNAEELGRHLLEEAERCGFLGAVGDLLNAINRREYPAERFEDLEEACDLDSDVDKLRHAVVELLQEKRIPTSLIAATFVGWGQNVLDEEAEGVFHLPIC